MDEALDVTPTGYASGRAYAFNSLSTAFGHIKSWLGTPAGSSPTLIWCSPYFNATRGASYEIQEQLGVRIGGEQKLTPFPHWTLSEKGDGRRYSFVSEPTSDYFVNGQVCQAMGTGGWSPRHSFQTMHDTVDFYHGIGGLINLYTHSLSYLLNSTVDLGKGQALVPDYVMYSLNSQLHPRIWSTNAKGAGDWWQQRSLVNIRPTITVDGANKSTISMDITGGQSDATAVELVVPGTFYNLHVYTNNVAASSPAAYRTDGPDGRVVKILVGATVSSARVEYTLLPKAADDSYTVAMGCTLTIPSSSGVLANDTLPRSSTAVISGTGPSGLNLLSSGGFTYTPAAGASRLTTFQYTAHDSVGDSAAATANVLVVPASSWVDDFSRLGTESNPLGDWTPVAVSGDVPHSGWTVGNGQLRGAANWNDYATVYNSASSWGGSVDARIRFLGGPGGGGVGGRVQVPSGARYEAWVYPSHSPGGSASASTLRLVKFSSWIDFDTLVDSSVTSVQQLSTEVGISWHTLKMAFTPQDSQHLKIQVFYDGSQIGADYIDSTDQPGHSGPLPSGGVSLDVYNWVDTSSPTKPSVDPTYSILIDDIIATP